MEMIRDAGAMNSTEVGDYHVYIKIYYYWGRILNVHCIFYLYETINRVEDYSFKMYEECTYWLFKEGLWRCEYCLRELYIRIKDIYRWRRSRSGEYYMFRSIPKFGLLFNRWLVKYFNGEIFLKLVANMIFLLWKYLWN